MDNDDSFFSSIAFGTGVAGGLASSISRVQKDRNLFNEPITQLDPVINTIHNFANTYSSTNKQMKNWQISQLKDFANVSNSLSLANSKTIRKLFMNSVYSTDASGVLASTFSERLRGKSGRDLFLDIANIAQTSDSIYTRRAVSHFLTSVESLSHKLGTGQSLNFSSLVGKVKSIRSNLPLASLDPIMRTDILKMSQQLDMDVKISEVRRGGLATGAELHLEFGDWREGGFNIRIPRVMPDAPGIITKGDKQQSRYIAGTYGVVEDGILKQSFNHEQWVTRRALKDLIPKISNAQESGLSVHRLISQFENQMIEDPEWIPSIKKGLHQGIDEYTWARSQVMRLYTPEQTGVRKLSEFEYSDLIEQGFLSSDNKKIPIFPSSSPTSISKGVVSTIDTRGFMSLIPEASPYGRRPLQYLRPGYTPTKSALASMARNPRNELFNWASATVGIESPMLKTGYIASSHGPKLTNLGFSAEGQFLFSERIQPQLETFVWKQFDIDAKKIGELSDLVNLDETEWELGQQAKKGTFLGLAPGGKPVVLPEDMVLSHAVAFDKDPAKGDFIRVMAMEPQKDFQYFKSFGGVKGMGLRSTDERLGRIVSEVANVFDTNVDALITMDELSKNRGLHYNQMFTSLWDFSRINMNQGFTQTKIASNFNNDPLKVIEKIRSAATGGDMIDHDKMLVEIMGLARSAKLSPSQMGRVFGAVPEIYGFSTTNLQEDWTQTIMRGKGMNAKQIQKALSVPFSRGYWMKGRYGITPDEAGAIAKGYATGYTQLFFEGLGGPGSGHTATIEPRMFELLDAPHFGELGAQIKEDIGQRMIASNPERLAEQKILTKALQSTLDLEPIKDAMSAASLMQTGGMPEKGTAMAIKDIGDIYIPGSSELSQLAEYTTASEQRIKPELYYTYQDIIESTNLYDQGKLEETVMRKKVVTLSNELLAARMATVTGKGGLLRGRLPGSVFLTAVQPTLEDKIGEKMAGVTAPYAKKMFSQMEKLGIYDPKELQAMEKTLFTGGTIPGLVGRHPYIGPYSTQAINLKLTSGKDAVIKIKEDLARAVVSKYPVSKKAESVFLENALGALKDPSFTDNAMLEKLNNPIRLSPFVGVAGDVDGDILSIALAGPQLNKGLTAHIQDRKAIAEYEEYSIRSQLLKAKAKGENITLSKLMAGDVTKLGITQGGRLGKLSVGLQEYRAALLSNAGNLSSPERMQGLGLLEWFEQTPISGKHIAPGKEKQMISLLDDIQRSLNRKSAKGISEAARSVLLAAKQSGQSALEGGESVALLSNTGDIRNVNISGIDIDKTAANLIKAQQAFSSTQAGEITSKQLRKQIMGRGGSNRLLGNQEITNLLAQQTLDKSPFGGFFSQIEESVVQKGWFASHATDALTRMNQAIGIGQKLIQHAKPLAIGTGLGLAAAAILSEPPKILTEGANVPINMTTTPKTVDVPSNLHPDSHISGNPTAFSAMQNSARIAGPAESYRIDVSGNTRNQINVNNVNNQFRSIMDRTSINTTVRDKRRSLTAQQLNSILSNE